MPARWCAGADLRAAGIPPHAAWVAAKIYQVRGDLDNALASIQESVKLLEPGPGNTAQGQALNFVMALVQEGKILGEENAISLGRKKRLRC